MLRFSLCGIFLLSTVPSLVMAEGYPSRPTPGWTRSSLDELIFSKKTMTEKKQNLSDFVRRYEWFIERINDQRKAAELSAMEHMRLYVNAREDLVVSFFEVGIRDRNLGYYEETRRAVKGTSLEIEVLFQMACNLSYFDWPIEKIAQKRVDIYRQVVNHSEFLVYEDPGTQARHTDVLWLMARELMVLKKAEAVDAIIQYFDVGMRRHSISFGKHYLPKIWEQYKVYAGEMGFGIPGEKLMDARIRKYVGSKKRPLSIKEQSAIAAEYEARMNAVILRNLLDGLPEPHAGVISLGEKGNDIPREELGCLGTTNRWVELQINRAMRPVDGDGFHVSPESGMWRNTFEITPKIHTDIPVSDYVVSRFEIYYTGSSSGGKYDTKKVLSNWNMTVLDTAFFPGKAMLDCIDFKVVLELRFMNSDCPRLRFEKKYSVNMVSPLVEYSANLAITLDDLYLDTDWRVSSKDVLHVEDCGGDFVKYSTLPMYDFTTEFRGGIHRIPEDLMDRIKPGNKLDEPFVFTFPETVEGVVIAYFLRKEWHVFVTKFNWLGDERKRIFKGTIIEHGIDVKERITTCVQ